MSAIGSKADIASTGCDVAFDPKRSFWRDTNAAFEPCLFNRFLNNSASLHLFDNLIEFGLSSRRTAFRERQSDANGVESTGHNLCLGITACDQFDQPSVRAEHVCFATAQHVDGICRKVRAQWQPYQFR